MRAAGVAEISAHVFGANPEERDRTRAFLRRTQSISRDQTPVRGLIDRCSMHQPVCIATSYLP